VNLAATTVDAIAEKLHKTDVKQSIGTFFSKATHPRNARSSTLEMTSVVGHTPSVNLGSADTSITISNEDLTTLFDAAQNEVLRLMEKDSWVRYLQSSQFAAYARDHVRNAHEFVDTVEKKMLAQPLSSASTASASRSRSSATIPAEKENRVELDTRRSRADPEGTGDRSSAESTGEKLRSTKSEKQLRSSTEKRSSTADKPRTSTVVVVEPIAPTPEYPPVVDELNVPNTQDETRESIENIEVSIKDITSTSPSSTPFCGGDPEAYTELM